MKVELSKGAVPSFKYAEKEHYIVTDDHPDAPTGLGCAYRSRSRPVS